MITLFLDLLTVLLQALLEILFDALEIVHFSGDPTFLICRHSVQK